MRNNPITDAGKENRFARLWMMGEFQAPTADTPDTTLTYWFAAKQLSDAAADSGSVTIRFNEAYGVVEKNCTYTSTTVLGTVIAAL